MGEMRPRWAPEPHRGRQARGRSRSEGDKRAPAVTEGTRTSISDAVMLGYCRSELLANGCDITSEPARGTVGTWDASEWPDPGRRATTGLNNRWGRGQACGRQRRMLLGARRQEQGTQSDSPQGSHKPRRREQAWKYPERKARVPAGTAEGRTDGAQPWPHGRPSPSAGGQGLHPHGGLSRG